MHASTLKRLFVIAIFVFFAFAARAQENRFLYLQTETGQPFYVKLNNQIISSSAAGYLIIPKLSEGDYNLTLGFPKNEYPEEAFQITIDNTNKGFLLKNFGEKGWGLFNMQSLAVISGQNSNRNIADTEVKTEIKNDAFSNMLANVVKDSSILRSHEQVNQPAEIKKPEISLDAAASPIKKILSEKDPDGMQMVYVDNSENAVDTVRVYIPEEKQPVKQAEENQQIKQPEEKSSVVQSDHVAKNDADTVRFTITPTIIYKDSDIITQEKDTIKIYKERPLKSDSVAIEPSRAENNESKPLITIIEPKTEKADKKPTKGNESNMVVLPKVVTSSSVNSDCKDFATNSDFLKLRKRMAAESGADNMIQAAKRVFRSKCFSTEQIRNLSFLFLTDEGKYMFLDAAYPFASDSDQYATLVSQLTDEYYITRFNAMIHK